LPQRRSSVQRSSQGLEISIPAKRNLFLLLFLGLWLVAWCFGEIFAIYTVFFGKADAPVPFLVVWLAGWTIGGAGVALVWFWMLRGREVIELRADALVVKRQVFGLGPTREYDLQHTKNLRVAPHSWNPYDWMSAMQFWGIGGGPIAFDYGSKTLRVGNTIDEAEAKQIVEELRADHPFSS
jgi:hypothetical protein